MPRSGWTTGGPLRRVKLVEPWTHDRGWLTLPTKPGLGFEINRLALFRYGKKFGNIGRVEVAISAVRDRGIRLARHLGGIRDKRLAARSAELDRLFASGETPVSLALKR
ncbi:MAG: hypothetical protein GWP91_05270 [Rhodobacterales bacterium]|nr:hypothetical protein [Rhodobacterales bacterium]